MKLHSYPQPKHSRIGNHSTLVIRWMGRNALSRLHEFADANAPFPETSELALWILDNSDRASQHFDADNIYNKAQDAAVWALDVWDADERAKRVTRGRNGGRMTRRRAMHTTDQLRKLGDISKRDAAIALKCSESTIANLRRAIKAEDREQRLAEIDSLFQETTDVQDATDLHAEQPDAGIDALFGPAPDLLFPKTNAPLREAQRRDAEIVVLADWRAGIDRAIEAETAERLADFATVLDGMVL